MSQLQTPSGNDRQVRYGRILGLFFCLAGFIVIGFGWNGMAKEACADCQLPYLLSGGAVGLGLILVGSALLLVAQLREERVKLSSELRQLGITLGKSSSSPSGGLQVVAGKSTYHRPDCRLVESKTDLDYVSVEVARLNGLTPCRVCRPPEGGDGAKSGKGSTTKPARAKSSSSRRKPAS